jgi:hypothetical protein
VRDITGYIKNNQYMMFLQVASANEFHLASLSEFLNPKSFANTTGTTKSKSTDKAPPV